MKKYNFYFKLDVNQSYVLKPPHWTKTSSISTIDIYGTEQKRFSTLKKVVTSENFSLTSTLVPGVFISVTETFGVN